MMRCDSSETDNFIPTDREADSSETDNFIPTDREAVFTVLQQRKNEHDKQQNLRRNMNKNITV